MPRPGALLAVAAAAATGAAAAGAAAGDPATLVVSTNVLQKR
jgi:hypothetical protein